MTDNNTLHTEITDELLENVSGGTCESYHRVTGTSGDGLQTVYYGMDKCSCCGQIRTGTFYQLGTVNACEDCFGNGKLSGWDSSKINSSV